MAHSLAVRYQHSIALLTIITAHYLFIATLEYWMGLE
jgi:uncharacterized membrane protein